MNKKIVLIFPFLFLLPSCATEVDSITNGIIDRSTNWEDNFYTNWDDGLKDIEFVNETERDLDDNDMVFRSFEDENFKAIAPDSSKFDYYSEDITDSYGLNNCLGTQSRKFKRKYTSKLFDGKMFCLARYEKVRVQIKESGIGINFNCKTKDNYCDYFALQFKSALDFKQHTPYFHFADIKLSISFYSENRGFYSKQKLNYVLTDVPTNVETYTFFGFSLANIDMNNVYGCSIEYKLLNDQYNNNEEEPLSHGLLLYELMIPKSIWE